MNRYEFKVTRTSRGMKEESGVISGQDAFGMALRLAEHWAATEGVPSRVKILRADTQGANAGKFVLYQRV